MLLTLPQCVQLTGQLPCTQGDFGLSLLQDGILPAAFMVRPSYSDLLALWHCKVLLSSLCGARWACLFHRRCSRRPANTATLSDS